MKVDNCFCGSKLSFLDCCNPIIKGTNRALTAESLMRSRYAAYATHQVGYLLATTHSSKRSCHSEKEILSWAKQNHWKQLEIIKSTEKTIEFKAYYINPDSELQVHHELSRFVFEHGKWYYVDGDYF
jgi:SEC-C motif-containing protein